MKIRRAPVSSDKRLKINREVMDYGPQERWNHSGRVLELTERAGILAARALEEHILDRLALAGLITVSQKEAGLRLKADYHAAGMEAHLSGSYNPTRTHFSFFCGWDERTDVQEIAYQRWRKAVRSMHSQIADIVLSVACHEIAPHPQKIGWLKVGLKNLVKWYQIPESNDNVDQAAAGQGSISRSRGDLVR